MNAEQLKQAVSNLSIWKKGDQRAPHKPLLILYALGKLQNEGITDIAYESSRNDLNNLLNEFGPPRKTSPRHPFTRLESDGIWKINVSLTNKNVSERFLVDNHVVGGFSNNVQLLLSNNPQLVREIAEIVLEEHFPDTIHDDILMAVVFNLNQIS